MLAEAPRRVAILLSTYNGARFLPEQLASFAAQTHGNWTLHWRDDGSRDNSAALLRGFAADHRCIEHATPAGNLGVLASYMLLLRAALPTLGPGDMIAFADQDDVWLPEKLARAAALLPAGGVALYCARTWRTDAALHRLGVSEPLRRPPGFPQAITQNIATGCTIALTRDAAALLAASIPPPGTLHDWWSYLVVSACGGAVLRDESPVLLYRQHSSNAVGAAPGWLARARGAWRRGPAAFLALLRAHVAALLALPGLTPSARGQLQRIAAGLAGGPVARLRVLAMPGLRRQGMWETLALRIWLLLGR